MNKSVVRNSFILRRDFSARRESVFDAWIDPNHLKHWWRPNGFRWVSDEIVYQPKRVFHYCTLLPDHRMMWATCVYNDLQRPARIVLTHSFSDQSGRTTRHPFICDWPLHVLMTVTLGQNRGKTELKLCAQPTNAPQRERDAFDRRRRALAELLAGLFDQLEDYLRAYQLGSNDHP